MRDLCILGDDFHCQILVVEHAPNALEGSFDESLHLLGVLLCVRAPGRKPGGADASKDYQVLACNQIRGLGKRKIA